jgi:hypothetical protein
MFENIIFQEMLWIMFPGEGKYDLDVGCIDDVSINLATSIFRAVETVVLTAGDGVVTLP